MKKIYENIQNPEIGKLLLKKYSAGLLYSLKLTALRLPIVDETYTIAITNEIRYVKKGKGRLW